MLIFIVSSCDRIEDGAYSPKTRISKMYYENWEGEKILSCIWNWDKKQLKSIDNIDYIEYYTYNKDGRIESIVDPTNEESIRYEYDGKKLSKAYYYDCGEIEYEYDFIYDGKKISEIGYIISYDEIYKKDSKKNRLDPIAIMLPQYDINKVKKFAAKTNVSKGGTIRIPIKLEWDNDNVSKMSADITIEGINYGIIMEYKYDDKMNPFTNLLSYYLEESCSFVFSKNNITEIKYIEYFNFEGEHNEYDDTEFVAYTYDGKYPITRDDGWGLEYFEYE